MKIFTSTQIKELDQYTIEHEPIKSIDLMERSAKAITLAIAKEWPSTTPIVVFAGPGNNGGDALAVSRMLALKGYAVSVYLFNISNHLSDDCTINRDRCAETKGIKNFVEVTHEFDPPRLDSGTLVVDGLFGTGLNKPLEKGFASLVKYINQSPCKVVSIDLPSGLMSESNTYNDHSHIIRADLTLTLGVKKLAMFFTDNQQYIGRLKVLDINLSEEYISKTNTMYTMQETDDVRALVVPRSDFAHKGLMGHALLIASSYGMAGAAILASRACLRSGTGKLTVLTPKHNLDILQITVPEAIIQVDHEDNHFSDAISADEFDALGIGPGLGQLEETAIALIAQLRRTQCPAVVDADALNIISQNCHMLDYIPSGSVITPHPGELARLTEKTDNCARMISNAIGLAYRKGLTLVVKGATTVTVLPDRKAYINTTGNAGMATGGSGDVLTGIVLALLAQGYSAEDSAIIAVYLHGLAGDMAAASLSQTAMTSADIISYLPKVWLNIEKV